MDNLGLRGQDSKTRMDGTGPLGEEVRERQDWETGEPVQDRQDRTAEED
jgi:hypothetical protein